MKQGRRGGGQSPRPSLFLVPSSIRPSSPSFSMSSSQPETPTPPSLANKMSSLYSSLTTKASQVATNVSSSIPLAPFSLPLGWSNYFPSSFFSFLFLLLPSSLHQSTPCSRLYPTPTSLLRSASRRRFDALLDERTSTRSDESKRARSRPPRLLQGRLSR